MAFAAYPAPFLFDEPGGKKKQQLLWGDFVRVFDEQEGAWRRVRGRGENGWMKSHDLQEERLLEVNFVDIGQGDGCFLVTPQDRFLLVDAGERDNMLRFLSWRFNLRKNPERRITFQAAIVSHPDQDHYKGFQPLLDSEQFGFETLYHNGIVERTGDDVLGPREKVGGVSCLLDLCPDRAGVDRILGDPAARGRKLYPKLLHTAATSDRVGDIRMLSVRDGHLPGYEDGEELSIRVLGPVLEEPGDGRLLLRYLGSDGKTKNGHSVVLRLRYRNVTMMLGGDLNIPAEEHLLRSHTGVEPRDAADPEVRQRLLAAARQVFRCDVAKACHHGSADFSDLYLEAVQPVATVISSGDDESHSHPRADTLGALGKTGRGERPLIFNTELARSSRESVKDPLALRQEIRELFDRREEEADPQRRAALDERIETALARIERSVAVYGMIAVRTDGHRVILSQKLERRRPGTGEGFDVYRLEPDADGELRYVSKH